MKRPRVLLADDHQMLLDALKELLEPNYEVVGLVSDGHALLKVASRYMKTLTILKTCHAAGGLGYVVKSLMDTDLVLAMNETLAGHIFTSRFSCQQNTPQGQRVNPQK